MTNAPFLVAVFATEGDVRDGLAAALEVDGALRTVQVSELAALETTVGALRPEVVAGDVSLVSSAPGATDGLRGLAPGIRVVVQARDARLDDAKRVLQARVDAYFPSATDDARLRATVLELARRARLAREVDGGGTRLAPLVQGSSGPPAARA